MSGSLVEADVRGRIARFLKVPVERLTDDADLAELVAESFVLVEMVIELQEQLRVRLTHEDLQAVRTVGQLVGLLEARRRGD